MTDPLRENVRIDKGLRRPRNKLKPISPQADLGTWKIPDNLDPDEVLAEYLAAATTSSIAARYGLSRKALVGWLRDKRPAAWKRVQVIRDLADKEDGRDGIAGAPDALSLARARELLKSGQWDLERLDSANYGPKQEVVHTLQPVFIINTAALPQANTIIDVEPDAQQQVENKEK